MPVFEHYLGCTEELSQELEEYFKCFKVNRNNVTALVIGFPFEFDRGTSFTGIGHGRRVDFLKFASILCKALVNHRCTDISLIADILYLICLMCSTLNDAAIEHYLDWLRRMSYETNSRRDVTKFEEILKISHNKLSYFLKPKEDIVRFAASTGNVGLLDVLLQFGAMPRYPEDDEYEHTHLQYVIGYLFKQAPLKFEFFKRPLLFNLHSEFRKDGIRRMYLMMIVLNIFKEIVNLTDGDFMLDHVRHILAEPPRLQISMEDLLGICHHRDCARRQLSRESLLRIDDYRDCARKLFTVIPDPFVSSDEIRRTLVKLLLNMYDYETIDLLVKRYESHFPESRETSAPRHLQHLCKVQVRESLRAAGTLTHGADLLPITEKMKDYVLLKDVCSPGNAISFDPLMLDKSLRPFFLFEGFQPK